MSREPVIGGDTDNWGSVLNDFLSVSHQADGNLSLLAGTSLPHTPDNGLTSEVALRGSVITVRNEKLNAVEAGYLTQGTAADQHTGLQSFLTAIGTAVGGRGGMGFIPSGVYHMGNGTVSYPSSVTCCVEGEMGAPAYGTATSGIGGTCLMWDSDIAGANDLVWGITLGGPGNKPQSLSRVTLEGPGGHSSSGGIVPCALGAINARENNQLTDLNIENFSSGVGWGGTGHSYDHSTPKNLRIGFVGYGFNFLTGSTGAGDFHAYGCNLAGNLAAVGVASGCSSGLAGSSWVGVGFLGPIGIHRYNDASGLQADFIDDTTFIMCSFETAGVASIFDDLWQDGAHGGAIQYSLFSNGFGYQAPSVGQTQWSKLFNVSASGGTSLTLTDGNGFMFRAGMTVTGAGIPANTVINSVAGSWPWATVVLTLNNSVTSPTTATVGMPLLASWVANTVIGNDVVGSVNGSTGFPLVAAGVVARNRVRDPLGCLTRAQAGPMLVGNTASAPVRAFGNTFGDYGDAGCVVLGSASLASGTIIAGDVLMFKSGSNVGKCDGTNRPCGIAVRANNHTSNGDVDYLVKASTYATGGTTIPVNNYTASNIAANALVKVDVANPGGVTTAASPNDGWVIGVNGNSIITAGTAGTLAEVWL